MNVVIVKKEPALLVILAFLAIYIVWGTTFLAILFGLEGFPPFLLSALRFFIAGIILMIWCIYKKQKLPVGKDFRIIVISGIVMLVGGSGLITWSEQYIPSGQAAIITATEPFMFLLLDRKKWPFYFSQKSIVLGLILGFTGIIIFFVFAKDVPSADVSAFLKLMGILVAFISAVLWVTGSLYSKTKKDRSIANTTTSAIQLIAAGLFSWLLSLVTGENDHFSFTGIHLKAWLGLLYLIIFGSVITFLAFTWLLTVRAPAQVSTHTYINPVIAVIAGSVFAQELLNTWQVAGLIIILAGVLLTIKKVSH